MRDWEWDPLAWKLPIPPKVGDAMDDAQKWAVACTRMALADAGWPERPLDLDRTAVILGNAMAGEKHYLTTLRIMFPELARELERAASFAALPADVRATIEGELHANLDAWLPAITEDTMPGELGNCIAGRIANLFNLHGPNFTVDAACASAMAAMDATVDGLLAHEFDVAITGGVDRNMGVSHVRQVLRDRRAVAERHAPVRGRRRRLRDGRGRGAVRASSGSPTPSATATASTPWSAASAAPATARARASPRPTPSASASRSSAPGATPGCRPRSAR